MTGFIYKITNKLNGKVYIGKTLCSIEHRWKEHIKASKEHRCENRPLYRAINKYGVENFSIEAIEECDHNILSDREIYWINYYDSYGNGYNATLGGDGKVLYDYEQILAKFEEGLLIKEIAEYFGCCIEVVTKVISNAGINGNKNNIDKVSKKVVMCDKATGKELKTFYSQTEAARWLMENNYTKAKDSSKISYNIGRTIKGEANRKSAYGFLWKYGEVPNDGKGDGLLNR